MMSDHTFGRLCKAAIVFALIIGAVGALIDARVPILAVVAIVFCALIIDGFRHGW